MKTGDGGGQFGGNFLSRIFWPTSPQITHHHAQVIPRCYPQDMGITIFWLLSASVSQVGETILNLRHIVLELGVFANFATHLVVPVHNRGVVTTPEFAPNLGVGHV